MRVLIRTWIGQGSQRSAQDRVLDVERLRIGRGTEQDIEIADLRVPLRYAEILRTGPRAQFTVQACGDVRIRINDELVERRALHPGDALGCGRFRVRIGKPPSPEVELMVEVEELSSTREEKTQRLSRIPTTLEAAGLSRRRLSWLLFAAILLTTLLVPAWLRFGIPTAADSVPRHIVPTDALWVPGPSSPAHAFFQNDCQRCHQEPFVHVRNQACLDCHKSMPAHVDDVRIAALPAFAGARCEDCHVEHQGQSMIDSHNRRCTQCHADPRRQFPNLELEAADSFSSRHPPFRPLVSRFDPDLQKFRWVAVKQTQAAELHNDTNFIYPHDKHLDPAGIKSPTGQRVLKCDDCHEADASGVSFKPVEMEKHCAECHRLDFDPDDPTRTVPHGDPALAVQTIRDYYARAALAGGVTKPGAPAIVQLVRKPGERLTPPQAQIALAWADRQSALVIDEVFDKRICGDCHLVSRTGDPNLPFRIAPLALQDHGVALPYSRFSHAAHKTEKCTSCHAAEKSKRSEDVLLPDIRRCRDCHADVSDGKKLASPCVECHRYHMAQQRTMDEYAAAATPATAMVESGP